MMRSLIVVVSLFGCQPLLESEPERACEWACQREGLTRPPVEEELESVRPLGAVITLSPTIKDPQPCAQFRVSARKASITSDGTSFGEGTYRVQVGDCKQGPYLAEGNVNQEPQLLEAVIDLRQFIGAEPVSLCMVKAAMSSKDYWYSDLVTVRRICVPKAPSPSDEEISLGTTEEMVGCDIQRWGCTLGEVEQHPDCEASLQLTRCRSTEHPNRSYRETLTRLQEIPGDVYTPDSPDALPITIEPFLMSTVEVSKRLWWLFMGGELSDICPEDSNRDQCPITEISWWAALEFTNRLSQAQGFEPCYELHDCHPALSSVHNRLSWCESVSRVPLCSGYRLPTEAEWRWAALGDAIGPLDLTAWYCSEEGDPRCTAPHLTDIWLWPNGYGLYDLLGNVREWVDGPPVCDQARGRLAYGGSFHSPAAETRVDAHKCVPASPGRRYIADDVGFRVVRSLPQ